MLDDGHTHFLGNQPVHSYFFRPNYKPQFLPASKPSPSNTIIIHKALVEEYALQELGFEFNSTDLGTYILDGRLTFVSIVNPPSIPYLITPHRTTSKPSSKDPFSCERTTTGACTDSSNATTPERQQPRKSPNHSTRTTTPNPLSTPALQRP